MLFCDYDGFEPVGWRGNTLTEMATSIKTPQAWMKVYYDNDLAEQSLQQWCAMIQNNMAMFRPFLNIVEMPQANSETARLYVRGNPAVEAHYKAFA